ncbi:MAG: hypothetical protein KME23_17445 [Goleter apudmare HA4340-LM2]|nr:hypothetical protein [Goleter apudmare HA4340-LM2]
MNKLSAFTELQKGLIMSRLKIGDLNFCEPVSGSQVQGGLNSSWQFLISYIGEKFQSKTFSDRQNDVGIEGYIDKDGYAIIGLSPDDKKQFIGLVRRSEDGGIIAMNYTKIVKQSTIQHDDLIP